MQEDIIEPESFAAPVIITPERYESIKADARRISRKVQRENRTLIPDLHDAKYIYAARLSNTQEVIGIIDLRKRPNSPTELELSGQIDPDHQKKGIGTVMFELASKDIQEKHPEITAITSSVIPGSPADRTFNKVRGFKIDQARTESGRKHYRLDLAQ